MSPTQRSLAHCRKLGGVVGIVEHWNAFVHRRLDLFGFVDIVWVHDNTVTLIQTTSGKNVAARVEKIRENGNAQAIAAQSPNVRIVVHGWSKQGAHLKRKLWTLREVEPFAV